MPFVSKFKRTTIMFWGHFAIFLAHFGAASLDLVKVNMGVLVCMNLFLVFYQVSSGTICWIYIAEVVVDSALGLCVLLLFTTVFCLNLVVEFLIDWPAFGFAGVFYTMGFSSLLGSLFVKKYMKETQGLTDKQKKQLYFPKEA